jgi:hypothetical protein
MSEDRNLPKGGQWAEQQKKGMEKQEQAAKQQQAQNAGQQQQGGYGEVQTETGQMLKGPKPSKLPEEVLDGPKQMAGKDNGQKQMGGKSLKEGSNQQQHQGEDRTPDQTIGQVAHADGQKRQVGGAGEPQTTLMEPEKQGGNTRSA